MVGGIFVCMGYAVKIGTHAVDAVTGAEHVLLADGGEDLSEALVERLADLTAGGAHVAVDAVGSEQTAAASVLGLRRRGRHVQVGLLPPVDGHPRLPMDRVIARELDLLGSHGMAARDYPAMLDLIAAGLLDGRAAVDGRIIPTLEGRLRNDAIVRALAGF